MNATGKPSGHEETMGEFPESSSADRARQGVPGYEGLPLLSLLAAGTFSFVVLTMNPVLVVPMFAFPVAAVLIAPSALEIGGAWQGWLAFIVMAAGSFCLHWWAFTRTRSIWD